MNRPALLLLLLPWAALAVLPGCDGSEPGPSSTADADALAAPDLLADAEDDAAEPPPDAGPDPDAGGPDADTVAPPPLDLTEPLLPGEARAGVITAPAELLAGPKAEGRVGDVKLYNARAAFVVEGARRAGGYRYFGGHVVDAVPLGPDGAAGPDRFGEAFLAWNLDILYPDAVEVVADGRDGGAARVRVTGHTGPFAFADSFVALLLDRPAPELTVVYDYTLEPDASWLTLDVTVTNPAPVPLLLDLPLVMAHFGDGVFEWAPGPGFDAETEGGPIPFFGAAGRDVSYAILAERDDLSSIFTYSGVSIFQQEAWDLGAGESATWRAWIAVSGDGAEGLLAARRALLPDDAVRREVAGAVELPDTVAPDSAWIAVRAEGDVVTSAPVAADGGFTLRLAPGDYTVEAWADGHAPAPVVPLQVLPDQDATVALAIPQAARVTATVEEALTGEPVPARVTFIPQAGTPSPWPPGDVRPEKKSWSGNISAVALVTGPSETVILPAGTYRVVAGRGPTHSVDDRVVTVAPGDNPGLDLLIEQVIDTTGWISSDFHVHALWSPDSYVPYDIRARQAAAEDLDLPVISEHVYVSGFRQTPEDAGVGDHVIGMPAQEVTTFSFGHFNAFPLVWDPSKPNMGAVFPFDKDPIQLFAAIRAQNPGDEIIQINHPRGIGAGAYFSHVGLDAVQDTVKEPTRWSTDWDTIEVFNGSCGGADNGQVLQDWIGLTNHGYRKVLASGSDTHSEREPPGVPRNWIPVDFATVREDPENLVPVVRARRLVVSCGPFVTFEAVGPGGEVLGGLGDLVAADAGGEVRFRARVQAPGWMGVDAVRLRENGEVIDVVDVTDAVDPVVRFDGELTAAPAADAWYALEVLGSGSTWPQLLGGSPYALTNAIEVDRDGDGLWSPPAGGPPLPAP